MLNTLRHGLCRGKFMTDGVWWFFYFGHLPTSPMFLESLRSGTAQLLIFVLYAITMLSIYGGKLPSVIINKTSIYESVCSPHASHVHLCFVPVTIAVLQPLGEYSYWYPIIIIGIAGAAHQSWSANIYSVVGDMFPKSGSNHYQLGGMAGGIGSFLINKGSVNCSFTLMKPR